MLQPSSKWLLVAVHFIHLWSKLNCTHLSDCASVVPAGDLYVATGSSAVLTCSVEHGQDVRWLKGDLASPVSVADLNDSLLTSGLNTLTISNFSNTAHGGPYSCLVQGPLGHRQLTCPTQIHHASESPGTASARQRLFTHTLSHFRNNG